MILEYKDLVDLLGNFTYNYTYEDYLFSDDNLAQPCQFTFCLNFSSSILAFRVAAGVLGLLCSVGLAITLAKCPRLWNQHHTRKYKLFLMSAATTIFATTLLFFAVEINHGWIFGYRFCQVARALKYGCLFVQGLLLAGSACQIPWALPNSLLLTVLWIMGYLCATPVAMISSPDDVCAPCLKPQRHSGSLAHTIVSLAILLILPLVMLLTKLALKWHGKNGCLQIDRTWLFYLFWFPYGVALILDTLLQEGLITSTCRFEEHLEYFFGISVGFGILHCFLLPLLILSLSICH